VAWDALPGTAARGRGWALVSGDCLEALERLPPHSVDVAFADPPYHLSNGGTTCQSGRRVRVDKGDWDASRGVDADHAFQARWLSAVRRALKPGGTLWVSGTQHVIFSIGYAMQELGFHLLNTVTWYKPNASPNLACRFFTHSTELLLWASPSRSRPLAHRFNYGAMKERNGGKQMRDLWQIPEPDGEQVVWSVPTPGPREKVHGRHPTQKPLALLDRVLAASAAPGDLVLDPFAGSGTSGVAALQAGCRFLGVERDPAYVDLAARRLRAASR
jgi:site-specific DNA-methyltransferase (adenine-specific)